jgi:hypothetical protein
MITLFSNAPREREAIIATFNRQIEQGINATSCKEGLRNVLENTPELPPYVNDSYS